VRADESGPAGDDRTHDAEDISRCATLWFDKAIADGGRSPKGGRLNGGSPV
jgi:hypothetical protein